jgi:hypothetical protein
MDPRQPLQPIILYSGGERKTASSTSIVGQMRCPLCAMNGHRAVHSMTSSANNKNLRESRGPVFSPFSDLGQPQALSGAPRQIGRTGPLRITEGNRFRPSVVGSESEAESLRFHWAQSDKSGPGSQIRAFSGSGARRSVKLLGVEFATFYSCDLRAHECGTIFEILRAILRSGFQLTVIPGQSLEMLPMPVGKCRIAGCRVGKRGIEAKLCRFKL